MITKASIRNFKCLRDVQIDLERFTVFVGPNASGKSSILQALGVLCRNFRTDHPENLDNELRQSTSRGATDGIELAAVASGKAFRYRVGFASTQPIPPIHQVKWTGNGRGFAADPATADWKQWKSDSAGSNPLPLSVLLHLETSKLVHPNPAAPDPAVMAPDGTGLHSASANMALNDPDSWQQLQADLRRIIPTIRRLRHTKTTTVHEPRALLFDTVGADSLLAHQVSEGTLLVLGLLTALHSSSRPNLILLDDLDRGLHPRAQKELIALLRGLLKTNPDLQLLATTHSPYLLDSMEAKEVRMTILQEDGSTVCAALASHPKFERWKDEMTPGEMWSLFGEKWMVEQEAAS